MDQGIPVFGVNADSSDSKRISFHALNEFAAGKTAGIITGEYAIANGLDWTTAALMTGSVEGGWAQGRMTGFVEGLNATLPGLEWANTSTENIESQGWDPATSYASVEAWVLGHPDVDIIFHTDQGVTNVAKAIADNGLSGQMYTTGFNIDPATADYIRSGQIIATMVQGFSNQAARGAQACADFLLDGNFDVGHVIMEPVSVTKDNVDSVDWTDPKNL
jgi:ribose transport system substrate-binding protein